MVIEKRKNDGLNRLKSNNTSSNNSNNSYSSNNSSCSVFLFVPRAEEGIIALGGTIAKHISRGDEVFVFIGSFGELSHPHFKPEIIKKRRVKEAQRAYKILGVSNILFLGLRDGFIKDDLSKKGSLIRKMILEKLLFMRPYRAYIPGNAGDSDTVLFSEFLKKTFFSFFKKSSKNLKKKSARDFSTIYDLRLFSYYLKPKLIRPKKPVLIVDISDFFKDKDRSLKSFETHTGLSNYSIKYFLLYYYHKIMNRFWAIRINDMIDDIDSIDDIDDINDMRDDISSDIRNNLAVKRIKGLKEKIKQTKLNEINNALIFKRGELAFLEESFSYKLLKQKEPSK